VNRWMTRDPHPIPMVVGFRYQPSAGLPGGWESHFLAQLGQHILGFVTGLHPAQHVQSTFNARYLFRYDPAAVARDEIRSLIASDDALKGLVGEVLCYWARQSFNPPLHIDAPKPNPREQGKDFLEIFVDNALAYLIIWEAKCTTQNPLDASSEAIRYFGLIEQKRRLSDLNYRLGRTLAIVRGIPAAQHFHGQLQTISNRKRYGVFAAFDSTAHAIPGALNTYPLNVTGVVARRQAHYVPWPGINGMISELRRAILANLP